MQRRRILYGLLALGIVGFLSYCLSVNQHRRDFTQAFSNLATGIGIVILIISIFVAIDANNKTRQSSEFSAIMSFHERLSTDKNYQMRSYILTEFSKQLGIAVGVTWENDSDKLREREPNGYHRVIVERVLSEMRQDPASKLKFDKELNRLKSPPNDFSALEAVQLILLDFDFLAIPYHAGIESVRKIAPSWKSVLESTAKEILPFVAIQKQLRGDTDPEYKKHYLFLLMSLGIDLQGLHVPIEKRQS